MSSDAVEDAAARIAVIADEVQGAMHGNASGSALVESARKYTASVLPPGAGRTWEQERAALENSFRGCLRAPQPAHSIQFGCQNSVYGQVQWCSYCFAFFCVQAVSETRFPSVLLARGSRWTRC